MARCLLADGRCGRLGRPCRSGQCVARTVRRLRDRRWREKLGLFIAEGEDLVEAAAGVEPVDLLVAGESVEPALLAEVSTLALWHVADPGNVGTLLRSADAFGAGVALSSGCADPTGPKALRASMGALFRVPIVPFDEAAGRRIALVPHGGTPLAELELSGEIVFVLGAERDGLPPEMLERCDVQASIPQQGESLNVAMAGTIALYELSRRQA